MRLSQALFLTACAHLAFAYPELTVPAAGASLTAGTAFTVTWTDNSKSPLLADLTSYELFLYTGTNDSPQQLAALIPSGTFSSAASQSTTVSVTASLGGELTNAYFLGMVATATAGGTVTSYSSRFSISGMTGSFATTFTVSGTDGPADVNSASTSTKTKTSSTSTSTSTTSTSAAAAASGDLWAIPYESQTGLTKYAAMQPLPPTSITATNTAPQHSTSSAKLATTYLTPATVVITLTQAQTATFSSHANTASPATMPADDMQKFLNRWKD